MLMVALVTLVGLGLVLTVAVHLSQRALLQSTPPPPPIASAASDSPPPVSVLKPLKGLDESLEDNLRSFFAIDYPDFELLFGVADADDPALDVVRRTIADHPQVRPRNVIDERKVGLNPKVNNLANLARHAANDLLLVSDSNVRVDPDYLEDLVARMAAPGVGLVSSPIRARGEHGLGSVLEAMHLNTFVMGGVASATAILRMTIVVGKSMLFRRSTLEAIGGFAHLGRHLAEDQVCGEDVRAAGQRVVVTGRPVDNVLGRGGLVGFGRRIHRWALMRRHMCPIGYAGETLLNPVFIALVALAIGPSALTATATAVALLAMSAHAAIAERRLGVRRPLLAYPGLELLRSAIVGILAPLPLFASTVTWRGNAFRVGPRTRLSPVNEITPDPIPEARATG